MASDWITNILEILGQYGFLGIALALMIEIIPSEIVLGYGGYLISSGKISFISALLAGITGGTIAQLFLYWLGKYGGRPFFDKYGKFLFIKQKHLDAAEGWFNQYGTIVIFTARFIPIVRHAISIPAGIARMSFYHFLIYTLAAMLPWTILFLLIGMQLNQHWNTISGVANAYIKPIVIIAIGSLIIYFCFHYIHKKRRN
ncbi:DedA family protein [Heyndrickxia sp. NPDC080065]|uniref:DedA family protein n=1 Tax=Heyndrickxia sp. NPDC080065 TaxID=3390568 RepID=UPI003D073227